jgi:hypothetical protein
MEERNQQHERAKGRTQIRRRHKRNDEKGAGGNLQTTNGIHQSYPRTLNELHQQPTVDHVLWDCKETEEIKKELKMTPEVWKEGEEGMRKIVEYTKKIGFYDGIPS